MTQYRWLGFVIVLEWLLGGYISIACADTLLFREDFREIAAELPITQAHIGHPSLELRLYGPGASTVKKSHHPEIENDPFYVWSGAAEGNWAFALLHVPGAIDLSGASFIRWRTRQSGFRQLRVILKLESGQWLISDQFEGASDTWQVTEVALDAVRWRQLDVDLVQESEWVDNPELGHVIEAGFTDLMVGGHSAASSRVDWIEVHGSKPQ